MHSARLSSKAFCRNFVPRGHGSAEPGGGTVTYGRVFFRGPPQKKINNNKSTTATKTNKKLVGFLLVSWRVGLFVLELLL